ncbi:MULTISPECIES: TAXI family TRAP transporter solute-binding subunit [unclassified Facklamia]|uniref:TAXI family TRAP transporter solute-binding subunit n=1 Tax=Aerococcaceae TaxID=186827 RepID=UPI0013BB1F97|nr:MULTISPECIES: TAXI family TRAP transporter solute-binding subunit [unclassified Facklamia]MBS4462394.1 TAXI family TRAP transporter solute-binding subunit [Aerococcaceae bacterium zg-B36]NEW64906.1 TAXI family TRAP transporter solute-binding subunit [Facklamia sp. 252]NEW68228.1 TAXI family TRAP transporter solute-binding subunit [Facklamia sp. 253]QQD66071.1 TAXI family TRAP transporter solute-binding subunit [Aerococcaceae bacterium zg-252]
MICKKNKLVFLVFSILVSAILNTSFLIVNAQNKQDIVIGTGGTAGTYYVVAAAMANAVNQNSDLVNVIVQPTNGSLENLNLVHNGDIQMGMSNSDGVYFAANGTNTYESVGKLNIKGLMSLYMSAGQMATLRKSGIETYADLKGKKVVLGPQGTTIVEMSKAILRAYNIDPEKDITPFYLSFDEGLQKLTDGEIDATFFVAGVPTSAMINATSTNDIRLVDISDEIVKTISEKYSYYKPYVIPGGTYKGIDEDVNSFKIMTEVFIGADVPEEIAYEFVKQALEHLDEYKESHVVAKEISLEQVAKTSAELHPGAKKYYEEVGALD